MRSLVVLAIFALSLPATARTANSAASTSSSLEQSSIQGMGEAWSYDGRSSFANPVSYQTEKARVQRMIDDLLTESKGKKGNGGSAQEADASK